MADIEIDGTERVPWWRWGFVDGVVRLMMGMSMAISALPREFWGLLVLLVGAGLLELANDKTLSLISGIIGAGTSLLSTGIARPGKKDDQK